jgi:hypothetical protein
MQPPERACRVTSYEDAFKEYESSDSEYEVEEFDLDTLHPVHRLLVELHRKQTPIAPTKDHEDVIEPHPIERILNDRYKELESDTSDSEYKNSDDDGMERDSSGSDDDDDDDDDDSDDDDDDSDESDTDADLDPMYML